MRGLRRRRRRRRGLWVGKIVVFSLTREVLLERGEGNEIERNR